MSQDRPSINDILLTVQKFLDDTGPTMSGEAKYHAQVSSYLLGLPEPRNSESCAASLRS